MSALTVPDDGDRESWLEWRRGGIGGSDVAAVLGISPYASPWSVWADKLGLVPPEDESDVMEFGRRAEAMLGPWFADRTGLYVYGEQTWCTHPVTDWHRATVDGFVGESPGSGDGPVEDMLGLLEIKTTGPGRDEALPPHWQAQGQWQMHVTGLDRVWFAILRGRHLQITELARDQADIDLMVARVDAFWADHIVTATPPPVDSHEATTRALGLVYPDSQPDAVEINGALVADWLAAKEITKAAAASEKAYANEVRAVLGDAEVATVDGRKVASWKTQEARRVDLDSLRKAYPEVAESCTVVSTSRVLRSHAPKE